MLDGKQPVRKEPLRCNKFGIRYLFNDVPISLYQSLFDVLYFMSIFACIFCIVYDLGALRVAKKI